MAHTKTGSGNLLTLAEIAAWQIAHPPAKAGPIVASLPALQRGAVWKVKQIEDLWDSIFRRFPIGSFVIASPNDDLKQQDFKLQSEDGGLPTPTHLLLDGQQRATGIALGFYDIWRVNANADHAKSAFWLDLAVPPESREAEYIFRVVTRAHPWGYKRSNPDETLSARQIRAALLAFRAFNQCDHKRPEEFELRETWPWDSESPVPLAILIDAVNKHADDLATVRNVAWNRIQQLPMFAANPSFTSDEVDNQRAIQEAQDGLEKQRQSISSAFEKKDSPLYRRLDSVLRRLQQLINAEQCYQIPALLLDLEGQEKSEVFKINEESPSQPSPQGDAAKKDPIEVLFVRVNSAGTPLEGEELTYSLLKAAWPDAAKFIDGLTHKPALPSRIAMLCVRLVLARRQISSQGGKKLVMPPAPGVNEFRRLVRNQNPLHPNFNEDMKSFIEKEADSLFSEAWKFLTEKPFGLLPVLAVELAQKSPDVYFLLLRWLDRLRGANIPPEQIDATTHRRTLGFLTALAWFAPEKTKACSAIWSELQALVDNNRLQNRFNRTRFKMTCRMDTRLSLRMIPLPTADELEIACKKLILGYTGCVDTISRADSTIWSTWDWYTSFADKLVGKESNKVKWAPLLKPEAENDDSEIPDMSDSTLQAARHFVDTLYDSRPVLLYAQRDWLRKWYPRFDPSLPEYMEDKNRPWDYDHILPQNTLRTESGGSRRNIPQVIWDWCGSIGNLRAIPLEANRSDSDTSPTIKLDEVSAEAMRYYMNNGAEERQASFVEETTEWPWWKKSVPLNEGKQLENSRYLASAEYHECRKALIIAIVLRFIALYREWYKELKIEDLQGLRQQ